MLRMERPVKPRQMETTITLINIVFLMLIFFLIAGTIAPQTAADVKAVTTTDAEQAEQQKMLGVKTDGTMIYRGEPVTAEDYAAIATHDAENTGKEPVIRILPDQELAATKLLEIITSLRAATSAKIVIFSERAR